MVLSLAKASSGERWRSLFVGDSDGAREVVCASSSSSGGAAPPPAGSSRPLYSVSRSEDEAAVELPVPAWVTPADVRCAFGTDSLQVGTGAGEGWPLSLSVQSLVVYWRLTETFDDLWRSLWQSIGLPRVSKRM